MDFLSLLGMMIALLAVFGGNFIEGGSFSSLINMSALMIVMGGTFGAAILQTPRHQLLPALRMLRLAFIDSRIDFSEGKEKIFQWASIARREGFLGIEPAIDQEGDSFIKKGLEMLVDGSEPGIIRDTLLNDRYLSESHGSDAVHFYESMGGYAPTIGILGAVLGLIQVMSHLADPSQLGHGIAVAFVATIYGVGLANLLILPIAQKLKAIVQERTIYQEMMIDGIASIASGENPRSILVKLSGYGDQ